MIKWGLAIQGGGIRGAYAAGAVDVLMERELYASFCYGTSAGALVGANYTAHEKGRTLELMLKGMKNPHFASPVQFLKRGNMFNFQWLFKDIQKDFPFNEKFFFHSDTDFYCVSTNCLTGKPVYFSKNDEEIYPALASSCSLPLYTRRPLLVHEVPCLDGGIVERIPFHKMLEDGVTRILVVATRQKGFRYGDVSKLELDICRDRYKNYPQFVEAEIHNHALFNEHMDELEQLEKNGRVTVIWPSSPIDISFFEFREKKIFPLYELGKKDANAILDEFEQSLH